MRGIGYTCIVCGAKGIDRSGTGRRKFCSRQCSEEYWRKENGVGKKSPGCLFNDGVACEVQDCGKCGWHHNVEKRRKEALG